MSEPIESCALLVETAAAEISISGISSDDLTLEYEKDIDLTELVMSLSKRIDTGAPVILEMPTAEDDEKLTLVLGTIKDITEAYNASLEQPEEDSDNQSEASDGEDIPF